MKLSWKQVKSWVSPSTLFVYGSLAVWILYFYLFWSQAYMRQADGSVWAKSLGTWADGAAHLTYVSAMAERLPLELPVYAGKPFTYPFVADGLAALLVRAGVNLFAAYSTVGGILSAVCVVVFYWFYQQLLRNKVQAILSLHLFLLSGGVGFLVFLQDLTKQGLQILWQLPQEYTLHEIWYIRWINVVTAELIPQRALLLALPLGVIMLYWQWQLVTLEYRRIWLAFVSGLLMGLMPLIHPHSYIALAIFSVVCFGLTIVVKTKKDWRLNWPAVWHWLIFGHLALGLSLPIIWFHILPASDQSFLQWWPGWLARSFGSNWLWFWFMNLGVYWLLAALGMRLLKPELRRFLWGFWLVFGVANLVLFQPYDWDNAKVITWSLAGLAPAVVVWLSHYWQQSWVFKSMAGLIFVSLIFSGTLDVIRQLQPHVNVPMYTPSDLELADWVRQNTLPESVFLTSSDHTHPVPSLTGRQIVLGYPGWLWSYGIDFWPREVLVHSFYEQPARDFSLLEELAVDYVVVGPSELRQFATSRDLFGEFEVVYETDEYVVFKI